MIKRFFNPPIKSTLDIGTILRKQGEALGIHAGMTIEEKYDKFLEAQKNGKIPSSLTILNPRESTLKECKIVCNNEKVIEVTDYTVKKP